MSDKEFSVSDYILHAPSELQVGLRAMRALIREVAPDAQERTDYFQLPGYSYPGYDYEGMFVWFSYKTTNLRLHVRPPVLENHESETAGLKQTKSIIDFPIKNEVPKELIMKLVQASIDVMKEKAL